MVGFFFTYFLTDFIGVLTGDDKLTVYVDGVLVGENGGHWYASKWFSFSSKTKLIAVSVTNIPGGYGGFLGVFSNGVVTDSSWKCKETHSPVVGWERLDFSDDEWPYAYITYSNSGSLAVDGIPPDVHWITPANHYADRFLCRRRFNTAERVSNKSKYP